MNTYDVVLYLHLLSLFTLVGGITVLGLSYLRLRVAGSLTDAASWTTLADQIGWAFPVSVIGLLATGGYLTSRAWTWTTDWVVVSIAGLALVMVQGPLVAGPRARALKLAFDESGSGPIDERTPRLARDPALWIVILANPGVVLGITWNMTAKPGTAGAIAAVVIGYTAGAAAALLLTRRQLAQPGAKLPG
jgi:Predicted integral membrane protein (DUF2269)